MKLVLCERYSTKMTAGACEKFKANTPERCAGCDGPLSDAVLDDPVVMTTAVHAKPKTVPPGVDSANRDAQVRTKKEEVAAVVTSERKQTKKVAVCGKCAEMKPIMARGLCGKCWHQEKGAGTLDQNFPSKYQQGAIAVESSPAPSSVGDAEPFVAETFEQRCAPVDPLYGTPCVTISFADDDQVLFDFLTSVAKSNRRSIDQEILFRLDQGAVV